MDGYSIALIIAGAAILIVFLVQFRLLSTKGIIFAVAAAGTVVGLSILQGRRRGALMRELKKKEEELKDQEKRLVELQKQYNLVQNELREANEALQREKVRYQKRILQIDADSKVVIFIWVGAIFALPVSSANRCYGQQITEIQPIGNNFQMRIGGNLYLAIPWQTAQEILRRMLYRSSCWEFP